MSRAYVISLVVLGFLLIAAQDNLPTLSIVRDDTNIVIKNLDASADARSPLNNKNCEEGNLLSVFYGPNAGFVETITDETKLTSAIVFIKKPSSENTSDDAQKEQETLELFGGKLTFNRPRCPESIERSDDPKSVKLEQGRTTIYGVKFFLDRESNIGTMEGPVDLQRIAEGDSPALSATADSLEFDVDTDKSILTGNAKITSEERVSEAETVEFDEKNSIAILHGSPAISREGEDFLQGETIIYYLDKNDVVVKGSLEGEITVDLGEDDASAEAPVPDEAGEQVPTEPDPDAEEE